MIKKRQRHNLILEQFTMQGIGEVLSTKDLAEQFDVSEMTIRRDLQELEDAGLLLRKHGGAKLPAAQDLLGQRKRSVGIILVEQQGKFSNPFFNELLSGADKKIQELGYESAFVKTVTEINTFRAAQELMITHPIDGLLIIGKLTMQTESSKFWRSNVRHIVSTPSSIGVDYDAVMFDGRYGMQAIVDHLVSLGHERIGFISGFADGRQEGYLLGLKAHQLATPPEYCVHVDFGMEGWTPEIGYRGAETLMQLDVPPTAIMCASDRIAFGAMQWLHQNDYRVPQDVAVTGFDNISDSEFIVPALTTVNVHKTELGELAIERLDHHMTHDNALPLQIYTPTSLVVRESCGSKL